MQFLRPNIVKPEELKWKGAVHIVDQESTIWRIGSKIVRVENLEVSKDRYFTTLKIKFMQLYTKV